MGAPQKISIGQQLLQERAANDWTQLALANKIGVTEGTINRWEQGKNPPGPYFRAKLCKVFGKTLDELFGSSQGEKPSPIWNVPQHRNLYFTGRDDILTRLHENFSSKKTIALTQPHAISGLGGIGKTQVAIEYAYRHANEYNPVLWVQADSQELLISEFAKLASLLNLPEKEQNDQNMVVAAVQSWLQSNTKWLLIVDNADDIRTVLEFLPTRGTGHILLTTRSQPTGNKIIGIEVEKMRREEGVLFVLRRAKIIAEDAPIESASEAQRKDADRLYDLLDGLPLALDQAASYIEEKQASLQKYFDLYETRYNDLWKFRGDFSKRDYPKSVATTWSLNFERMEQNNPAAAELLRLCAFLYPDDIPEELIISGAGELGPILQAMAVDPIRLDEAIGELGKYSLVQRNAETKTLSIHRLVQAVLKESMDKQTRRVWAERTTRAINLAFPNVKDIMLWEKCQRYLPHALVCARLMKDYRFAFAEASHLLNETAAYLYRHAQYTQAEPLLIRALAIREQQLGSEHPDTAQSLNNLAVLYRTQGKYTQAEPLLIRALAIREEQLGSEHPRLARCLHNLGTLYHDQGKYEQAEPLLIRALAIKEQQLGSEHPDTAQSLNNLGMLYRTQGKYEQAEPLLIRALAIREQQLGSEHPDTAISLNNLAILYMHQGKYEQAEPLYHRALAIVEEQLGSEHHIVITIRKNLVDLLKIMGRTSEAEKQEKLIKRI